MAKINLLSIFIILIFTYPLIRGFIKKYNSLYTKERLMEFERGLASMVSIVLGLLLFRSFLLDKSSTLYSLFSYNTKAFMDTYPWIIYIVGLPLIIFIVYKCLIFIIILINSLALFPIINIFHEISRQRPEILKRIFGALAELPRALCNVIVIVFVLNFAETLTIKNSFNAHLQESVIYREISSRMVEPVTNSVVAKAIPGIVDSTFKVKIQQANGTYIWEDIKRLKDLSLNNNQIIYYNGVTLEEGIRSNEDINGFAIELTKGLDSQRAKARAIYTFVGSTIEYDDHKAEKVLNNDFAFKSGAIDAFTTSKGVCFDYACLYTAMVKALGIKVRLITGEAYNGLGWVSHAWNQVYLEDEGIWINVDCTFYKGGNYFNSKRFEQDHRNAVIAGEW